ncbi:MAG: aminotransferase class IV [Gemmatimonadaceae bacterium]|jgi:D-alanine transaminase|nr:aminotransferase class IV [Gemmatimonadaceae bacterium]
MSEIVWLDGQFLPRDEARIAVDDRGFIFGDGIYEVTRCVDGRLFEGRRHLVRMHAGLEGIRIAATHLPSDAELLALHHELLARNGLTVGQATVYLQITRGAAPRAHQFPAGDVRPTLFLSATRITPAESLRATGARAVLLPDLRWARCDLKTVNLLGAVLAKQRAVEAGAQEAVLHRDGVVTEGSITNVFGVLDGVVRTHPVGTRILRGVTRDVTLELLHAMGQPVEERALLVEELPLVSELFYTSTTQDAMPIVLLDERVIGDGTPGPVARRLGAAFAAALTDPARLT